MNRLYKTLLMTVIILGFFAFTIDTAFAIWKSAYQVAFTHYSPWWEPHYGAWFNGANGQPGSAVFYGPSGSYSGYAWNNWWGNNLNVELLSKSWLFQGACPTPHGSICHDRWTGYYHHANLFQ